MTYDFDKDVERVAKILEETIKETPATMPIFKQKHVIPRMIAKFLVLEVLFNSEAVKMVRELQEENKRLLEANRHLKKHYDCLREDYDKLDERLEETEMKTVWRPIETAPKDGTWFLYLDADNFVSSAFTEDGVEYYGDHHSSTYGNKLYGLTHWMPLPQPPKEQQ